MEAYENRNGDSAGRASWGAEASGDEMQAGTAVVLAVLRGWLEAPERTDDEVRGLLARVRAMVAG